MNNLIQERLFNQAADLLRTLQSAASIPHGVTVGQIREAALRNSFDSLVPPNLSSYTGFVLDAYGVITPQLDIIFARQESLSPILLQGDSALIPVETYAFSIEVKSTLKKEHLDPQIKSQVKRLQEMRYTLSMPMPVSNSSISSVFRMPTPLCIVAYKSNVGIDKLQEFANENPSIRAIIVISNDGSCQKCSIVRGLEPTTNLNELESIIQLWSIIFQLGTEQNKRPMLSSEDLKKIEDIRKRYYPSLTQKHFDELLFTPKLSVYINLQHN